MRARVLSIVFVVVTWTVRRYLKQDRLVPSRLMNGLEAVVEFVRDSIVLPNVGRKWVNTWTPLLLTLFMFILSANAIGLVPFFDVLGLLDHYVLHTGEHSVLGNIIHGGTTATANFNVTAALATITFAAIIVAGTLARDAGGIVTVCSAAQHDRIVAVMSALPLAFASALAVTAADALGGDLASFSGPGFASGA